jgi:hypothetical protein
VIYAIPSDGGDRFADTAGRIVTDLEHIVRWWRSNDGTRQPRFDLFAFPGGCGSELAPLDLSFARLPGPSAAYGVSGVRFNAIRTALAGAGFAEAGKKYLVYYDGPVASDDVCGTGGGDSEEGGAGSYGIVWMQAQAFCGTVGEGDYAALVAVHEMIHELGALPDPVAGGGPPHVCPGDAGHPCDAVEDVLSPAGHSNALADYVLDVGHDDYYAHGGPWWDVQDSRWLRRLDRAEVPLTATLVGARTGDVVETTFPGIRCPAACAIGWETGDEVELVATPGEESVFLRWEGACSGADASCVLTLAGAAEARAVFGPASFPVTLRVRGKGRIGGTLGCRTTCRTTLAYDTPLRLVAVPARGWRLAGWSGACRGTRATCVVRVTAARAVTATFARRKR